MSKTALRSSFAVTDAIELLRKSLIRMHAVDGRYADQIRNLERTIERTIRDAETVRDTLESEWRTIYEKGH